MTKRKATFNEDLCKGCRLCTTVCPVEAIVPANKLNQNGYQVIQVWEDLCIGCGNCYRMCPDYCFEVK